jgi:glycosyltransferase involved in cell wall biosynthesis
VKDESNPRAGLLTPAVLAADALEVSVIMPCLNEADTLGTCLDKAARALRDNRIEGEIIVADNGSTDGSQLIAKVAGAQVVHVIEKGYGNALMGGISAARGTFVIMGDADDSYDFSDIPKFVEKLRQGFDLVQGCRFPSGGGAIQAGAMRFSHRWFGNPLFSLLVRLWFHAPVRDVYCGLRGFRRSMFHALDQRCTGMEFATEMIIKASLAGVRIAEAPVVLYRDGRKSHAPHLKTVRDGWRTLRYFLMCSPRWLFLIPGALLVLLGLAAYCLALPGIDLKGIRFDAHTLLFGSLFIICGYQSGLFALFARTFAYTAGLLPPNPRLLRFYEVMDLEKGLLAAGAAMVGGALLLLLAINQWRLAGFGDLNYAKTMRLVIPGATLITLGFQTFLSSFFISIMGMKHK